MSGFFEWHTEGKKKYPFYIYPNETGEGVVSIAGLWDEWADPETGEVRTTYTMLTRPANGLMAKIHNSKKRMPCLLTPKQEKAYLEESLKKEEVLELLTISYESGKLDAHPISRRITSRKKPTDVPEVLEPHEYAEMKGLC